jgi:hypothetical protein
MLVKCVCTDCGHSYLADDQAGELSCPRCGVGNEGTRNPSDIPDAPMGAEPGVYDPYYEDEGYDVDEPRFEARELPAMFITGERMVRGIIFGGLAALAMGAVLGASLGALKMAVPVVVGLVLALIAGPACRYGFGGRSAHDSTSRAATVLSIVVLVGFLGFLSGSWVVERFTGSRADQTRDDLEYGLSGLNAQLIRMHDEGNRIVLQERIAEVHRLQNLTDAQLEDYLWTQEAQINQPLLAYATLRAWKGPAIRLGVDSDPIDVPSPGTPAILLGEVIVAVWLGLRFVRAR